MKHPALRSAIATALGIAALTTIPVASAGVMSANWTGYFIMLDPAGAALANTSIFSKYNQYVTPVSGTLQFDDMTGAGTATLVPFQFFGGDPTFPASAVGINLQAIGDGMGGPGTLVLGNMLFNWNGGEGMPVSLVLDAAGFIAGEMTAGGPHSAVAAADGTYVGSQPGSFEDANGYLALGPMPMVTTAWNTSFRSGCTNGSCMGINPSGVLPLVLDTAPNNGGYDNLANTGALPGLWQPEGVVYGVGGNPMADGPFTGYSINLSFAGITTTGYDPFGMIFPDCEIDPHSMISDCGWVVPEVPVPAAVWLFGSGLLGLLSVARRRRA